MRELSFTVTNEKDGRQIKSLLKSELEISGSVIKQLKNIHGGILLNGASVYTDVRAKSGDVITVSIPTAVYKKNEYVIYEDEDILIFDKPAEMSVHPAGLTGGEVTVKDVLQADKGFHPVNRLDRGTTGLMAIAKSGYAHDRLKSLLHTDAYVREYAAVLDGVPKKMCGRIELPIKRIGAIERAVAEDGAEAITDYKVISVRGGRAFVKLRLSTGRTHQIRVHMAAIGCPLTGDWLYGKEDKSLIARPALHSWHINMLQPITKKTVDVFAEIPSDMKMLI